jgi:putative chitinase
MLITATQLSLTVPTLAPARSAQIASHMDFILPKYGINESGILHEFIANLAHESGAFRLKEENLRYRNAERIAATWPTRFTTLYRTRALQAKASQAGLQDRAKLIAQLELEKKKLSADAFTDNPERLANIVYGSRMGNKLPGDGWSFRGGGFSQTTGRGMYEEYRRYCQFDTIEHMADVVRKDDWWAIDSAAWFFSIQKGLIPLAVANQFEKVVLRWNGGLIGLKDRQYYYERAKLYIR